MWILRNMVMICRMIVTLVILVLSCNAQSTSCTCDGNAGGTPITVNPVLVCNANTSSPPDASHALSRTLADHGDRLAALEKTLGAASSSEMNCSTGNKGHFRFRADGDILQVCDGAEWQSILTTGSIKKRGSSRANAATSCQEIYATGQNTSGVYWINPDPSFYRPVRVYCEMMFNGGGWMRVFNMMAKPAGPQYAKDMYESIIRNDQIKVVLSNETTHAIHTAGLRLEMYREVVYGWAKSADHVVSHYGYYMKSTGIKSDCYVSAFCGNGGNIATMTSSPTGTKRQYVAPSNPTYPHVGVAWANYQIVWGYDKDAAPYGNWANWQDTSCCLAAAGKDIQDAGLSWRYAILLR